jgi:hypothetical protein
MRLPHFRVRTYIVFVVYAALDLAALHAAVWRGSSRGLAVFLLLTIGFPLVAILWWIIRQIRHNTLY